ncbi:MAG: glycerate kinase [Actinomycetota bacterium]
MAPDKFKGSLTALEATQAIERGIRRAVPNARVILCPMADGGEGTVEAMTNVPGGQTITVTVTGPLGNAVHSKFGILGPSIFSPVSLMRAGEAQLTGVIEMALASGIALVPPDKRNPMITTTYGTGELIRAALNEGCRKIVIGIGGSATTDGGMGMAQALGVTFRDGAGVELGLGSGQYLSDIAEIDVTGTDKGLKDLKVVIASDVKNPLCGPDGAAAVYGPQKGATPEMVKVLDVGLEHYAKVIKKKLGIEVNNVPGAGAAGGLGAGLMAFLGAEMKSGVDVVMDTVNFDYKLTQVDLVVTGEGQIDKQTLFGKAVAGVAERAKAKGVPVIAIAGSVKKDAEPLRERGLSEMHQFVTPGMTFDYAITYAAELLENKTAEVIAALE